MSKKPRDTSQRLKQLATKRPNGRSVTPALKTTVCAYACDPPLVAMRDVDYHHAKRACWEAAINGARLFDAEIEHYAIPLQEQRAAARRVVAVNGPPRTTPAHTLESLAVTAGTTADIWMNSDQKFSDLPGDAVRNAHHLLADEAFVTLYRGQPQATSTQKPSHPALEALLHASWYGYLIQMLIVAAPDPRPSCRSRTIDPNH